MARRTEVPVSPRVGEGGVPAEHPHRSISVAPPGVLDVDVEDPRAEGADELHIVDVLISQVRWVIVEPEPLVAFDRIDRPLGGGNVECDLRRMYLQPEVHIQLVELVEDRRESTGKIVEPLLPILLIGRGKGIDGMPDARPGESVDDRRESRRLRRRVDEGAARLGGVDQLLAGPLLDALSAAVPPYVGGEDRLVPLVDGITDRLPDQMIGNGKCLQPVALENVPAVFAIALVLQRLVHLEMVAPARELDAVISELPGLGADGLKR